MTFLGIDLGGTKMAALMFSDAGAVLAREWCALERDGGHSVGSQVSDMVRMFAGRVDSIGICVPGIYRHPTGTVWAPSHNVPGDTTAKQRLDEALAEYKRRIAGV